MSFLPTAPSTNVPVIAPSDIVVTSTIKPWVRPIEWLDLNKPEGVPEKIIGLVAIYPGELNAAYNYVSFILGTTVNGSTYTIDWGDGNIETAVEDQDQLHIYNYDDLPASTEYNGYRQARFEVTLNEGEFFGGTNKINFDRSSPVSNAGNTTFFGSAILDLFISTSACNDINTGTSYPLMDCEQVDIRNTANNRLINIPYELFGFKRSLKSIVGVPYLTEGSKNHSQTFNYCGSLEFIPDEFANPDKNWFDENTTTTTICFGNCASLKYIPPGLFGDFPNCTDFYRMFYGCSSLQLIPYIGMSSTLTNVRVREMFQYMPSLRALPKGFNITKAGSNQYYGIYGFAAVCGVITDFSSLNLEEPEGLIDMGTAFNVSSTQTFCQLVEFPFIGQFTKANLLFATFAAQTSLRRFSSQYTYLDFTNCTHLGQTFSNCSSLEELPPIHVTNLTNVNALAYTFAGCLRLKEINFVGMLAGPSDGEYFRFAQNCNNLRRISGVNFSYTNDSGDLDTAFSQCRNLLYIDFPGGPTDETGFKHSVILSYTRLNREAIVNIFNHLCTITHSATIDLRNNGHTVNLTAADKAIATDKGWTITL